MTHQTKNRINQAAIAIVVWAMNCGFSNAQTSSTAAENHAPVSPDKQWEYKCAPYGDECAPQLLKAGSTQVVIDLKEDLEMSASESPDAKIFWAPDSKRFALNYSPIHRHHIIVESVAFYQLQEGKWVQLREPAEDGNHNQLPQLANGHLPKGFNPHDCASDRDVVKVDRWVDASTVTLDALCYSRTTGTLSAGFLFTLKFDDAGKWKIVNTRRMSDKEVKERESEE